MTDIATITPQILRQPQVLELTGFSRSTLYRRIKQGDFPEQFRLGGPGSAAVGWKTDDVTRWLDELEPRN